jgi:hypothetical protein
MTDIALAAQAMLKSAEVLETNNDQSTVGVNNVYPKGDEREPGQLGAKWGDKPADQTAFSDAAKREAANDRPKMIERLFDSLKTTASADKALVAENFDHTDYESHNLTLQKSAELHGGETLTELVRRTCGRP